MKNVASIIVPIATAHGHWSKQARTAIASGNIEEAKEATRVAVRDLDMAASRGIIHAKNAARRKSRLMQQLAQLQS